MPHSKRSIPTACHAQSQTTNPLNDRLPTAPKPVHHPASKYCKANSAPAVLVNRRKYHRHSSANPNRTNEFYSSYTSTAVNNNPVTSRSASPSSSLSATETLATFSDSSSVTATEAASPKSTNASVASRRYKFKEEFGTENSVVAPVDGYEKQSKQAKYVGLGGQHQGIAKPAAHERTTGHAAKKEKTKARKKTSCNCAPNLDFAYRNVYASTAGIGGVGLPSAAGKGRRDIFEGPTIASAHVGCVVI